MSDVINNKENTERVELIRSWIATNGHRHGFLAKQIGLCSVQYLSAMIGRRRSRLVPNHVFVRIRNFYAKF